MFRYRTVLITQDPTLRQEVRRLGPAIGSAMECVDSAAAALTEGQHLIVYDAQKGPPEEAFLARLDEGSKIIYLVPGASLIDSLPLLWEEAAVGLLGYEGRLDDDEFIATATKALRADPFGLQKYFPWGVTTYTVQVQNHDEKDRALGVLLEYARAAGCRGPLRDRIQLCGDELMMNGLYHAPVDEEGRKIHDEKTLKELAHLAAVPPILLQYGCSGRYFGIAVRDGFGSLGRNTLLDYLCRARTGPTIEDKSMGAGLGLVSVLRSLSRMIVNIELGGSTEVIALFDRDLFAHGKIGAHSVHVFASVARQSQKQPTDQPAGPPPQQADPGPGDHPAQQPGRGPAGPPKLPGNRKIVATTLALLLGGLSTAYVAHKLDFSQIRGKLTQHNQPKKK